MRHIEVRGLWLKEEVRKGIVEVEKVKGSENPADLITKFLCKAEVEKKLRGMNVGVRCRKEGGGGGGPDRGYK